jgi:hypothetical protein
VARTATSTDAPDDPRGDLLWGTALYGPIVVSGDLGFSDSRAEIHQGKDGEYLGPGGYLRHGAYVGVLALFHRGVCTTLNFVFSDRDPASTVATLGPLGEEIKRRIDGASPGPEDAEGALAEAAQSDHRRGSRHRAVRLEAQEWPAGVCGHHLQRRERQRPDCVSQAGRVVPDSRGPLCQYVRSELL